MLGDEVANYLAGQGLGFSLTATTSGTQIFGVPFPPDATTDALACVIPYGGGENIDAFGPSLAAPLFQIARFQLLVRDHSNNQKNVVFLIEQAYRNLRHFVGSLTGTSGVSVRYVWVKSLQPPAFLKFDENQRCHWVWSAEAMKEES